MADFNEYNQKGAVLMQQALKKLAEEDYDGFDKDRDEANRYFDLAMKEMNTEEGKIRQVYGESRNFGVIYNVFEQNLVNLLKRKNGKNIIKKIYEKIKKNDILHDQFKAYNSFENINLIAEDIENKDYLATAMIRTIPTNYTKREIVEANDSLIAILRKYGLNELVDIPIDTENLYEAIETVMIKSDKLKDITRQTKAAKFLNEYVDRCCSEKNKTNVNTNSDFNTLKDEIKDAEKNISEDINEDEKNLIEKYLNPKTNKRQFFEDQKKETLRNLRKVINECDNEDDKKEWSDVIRLVENKTYNEEDGLSLVAEMIEINNSL